jgi:hypothetical protein
MPEGSWVGLDVHARMTVAGVLDAASGELRLERVSPHGSLPPESVPRARPSAAASQRRSSYRLSPEPSFFPPRTGLVRGSACRSTHYVRAGRLMIRLPIKDRREGTSAIDQAEYDQ